MRLFLISVFFINSIVAMDKSKLSAELAELGSLHEYYQGINALMRLYSSSFLDEMEPEVAQKILHHKVIVNRQLSAIYTNTKEYKYDEVKNIKIKNELGLVKINTDDTETVTLKVVQAGVSKKGLKKNKIKIKKIGDTLHVRTERDQGKIDCRVTMPSNINVEIENGHGDIVFMTCKVMSSIKLWSAWGDIIFGGSGFDPGSKLQAYRIATYDGPGTYLFSATAGSGAHKLSFVTSAGHQIISRQTILSEELDKI